MVREGYIERIKYHSDETGYSILSVSTNDGEETFVGNVSGVSEGMYIQAEGEFVHHQVYGIQFSFTGCELSLPEDIDGVIRFLSSGMIKGIGEVLAKRIVKKFGEDTLRIIDEEPERLAEVKGISERIAINIGVSYSENRSYQNVIMLLSNYGISTKNAIKIYKEFGDNIYDIVKNNPYQIADRVPGIGFKTVDSMAMKAGIAEDSVYRMESAILYTLGTAMGDGHMFLPEDELIKRLRKLFVSEADPYEYDDYYYEVYPEIPEKSPEEDDFERRVKDALKNMKVDSRIIVEDGIYLYFNYVIEKNSAVRLTDLMQKLPSDRSEVDLAINEVEEEFDIELAEQQRDAVRIAAGSGVSVITGGPGTGKTTIINAIIRYFERIGKKITLAAPTGRAAKRITESTGYKAQTIHRLLEFSGEPGDEDQRTRLKFMRNQDNPLEEDVIIIDEASMIDAALFHALLKAVPAGSRLILVGDTDQLPPVGAGNVLKDIIESDLFPMTILDKVFRQSDESSIIENAHKIKHGKRLELNNKSQDFFFIPRQSQNDILNEVKVLVTQNLPKYLGIPAMDIQVLTPTRKRGLGVVMLNKSLQACMNPPASNKREKEFGDVTYREGDKVMQIKNNYKLEWKIYADEERTRELDAGIGIFNGDMGIILEINDFDETITVGFDDGRIVEYEYNQLDELEHSFAVTVHKSQGSEYPAVVLPLHSGPPMLFNRNLLYTAVTRAEKMVVIVGNLNLVNSMIDNDNEQMRYSSFKDRLLECAARDEGEDIPKDIYMQLFDEDEPF